MDAIKVFVIFPWRKVMGEIIDNGTEFIRISRPLLIDEAPNPQDGKVQVMISNLGTPDEEVSFRKSAVIIEPMTPAAEYLKMYLSQVSSIIVPDMNRGAVDQVVKDIFSKSGR